MSFFLAELAAVLASVAMFDRHSAHDSFAGDVELEADGHGFRHELGLRQRVYANLRLARSGSHQASVYETDGHAERRGDLVHAFEAPKLDGVERDGLRQIERGGLPPQVAQQCHRGSDGRGLGIGLAWNTPTSPWWCWPTSLPCRSINSEGVISFAYPVVREAFQNLLTVLATGRVAEFSVTIKNLRRSQGDVVYLGIDTEPTDPEDLP